MNAHVEIRRALSSIALLVAVADLGGAQVPNASPAATGLSGAFTARARGYDAIAWNPANLGLRDNPRFSFSLLAISGSSGLAARSGVGVPSTMRSRPSTSMSSPLRSSRSPLGRIMHQTACARSGA